MIAHFYFPLFSSRKSHKERTAQERHVATRMLCHWIDTSYIQIIISLTSLVLSYLLHSIVPWIARFGGKICLAWNIRSDFLYYIYQKQFWIQEEFSKSYHKFT